jgi:GNAT superfamily N-acetyltransferase
MSLVLVDVNGSLIGHARLCPLPLESFAVWVESVAIWKRLRGRGIGKLLMAKLEGWARERKFEKVNYSHKIFISNLRSRYSFQQRIR